MAETVKNTLKNIDGAYLKAIEISDNRAITMVYYQVNKKVFQTQVRKGANLIAGLTGYGYHELKSHIQNRAITLCLNELLQYTQRQLTQVIAHTDDGTLFDNDYMGQNIKFAIQTVKSWAYSDKIKQFRAEQDLSVYDNTPHVENSQTVAVQDSRYKGGLTLLEGLITRKDQLEFLSSVIINGKETTKSRYSLDEKRFNEKIKRALATITKNRNKSTDDGDYIKAIVGELIETAYNTPLSEQEELESLYREAISA